MEAVVTSIERDDIKISDFGTAKISHATHTQIDGFLGSPAYMSPEQIREELVDHRTDLYSLGVVMYQMLTGKLPFQGSNKFSMIYQITQFEPAPPSSHRPEVPEALDRIVRRAMQKEARGRYQSADELIRNADLALYAAKADGRGVHRFYREEMLAGARAWIAAHPMDTQRMTTAARLLMQAGETDAAFAVHAVAVGTMLAIQTSRASSFIASHGTGGHVNQTGIQDGGRVHVGQLRQALPLVSVRNLEVAYGVITALHYSAALQTPANKKFAAAYEAKYKQIPSYYSEGTYVAGVALKDVRG